MNLVDEVVAASARPQKAFKWMLEMTHPRISYDDLRKTGDDVATLDTKMSSALAHVAPADFQILLHAEKLGAVWLSWVPSLCRSFRRGARLCAPSLLFVVLGPVSVPSHFCFLLS